MPSFPERRSNNQLIDTLSTVVSRNVSEVPNLHYLEPPLLEKISNMVIEEKPKQLSIDKFFKSTKIFNAKHSNQLLTYDKSKVINFDGLNIGNISKSTIFNNLTSLKNIEYYEVNSKYITETIRCPLPNTGVIAIRGIHSGGKSAFSKQCEEFGNTGRTIFMSNRCTTLANFHMDRFKDLNFMHYKFGTSAYSSHKLIVTPNSVYKVKDISTIETLYLDEFVSILRVLVKEKSLSHSFGVFKWLLKNCQRVILMDNDLSAEHIELVQILRQVENTVDGMKIKDKNIGNIHIVEHSRKCETPIFTTRSPMQWYSHLLASVKNGKKVAVPVTSNNEGTIILKYFKEKHPEIKVKFVEGKTDPTEKWNISMNINEEIKKYDVFIYTPTIENGISIDCNHIHVVYGYYVAGSVTMPQFCQMLRRVRHPEKIVAYIGKSSYDRRKLPVTYDELIQYYLDNYDHFMRAHSNIPEFDLNGKLVIDPNDFYIRATIVVDIESNRSKCQPLDYFNEIFADSVTLEDIENPDREMFEYVKEEKKVDACPEQLNLAETMVETLQQVEPGIRDEHVEKSLFVDMNFENKRTKTDYEHQIQLSDPESKKHYTDIIFKDKLHNLQKAKNLASNYNTTPEFMLNTISYRCKKRYVSLLIAEKCGADPYNVISPDRTLKITDSVKNYINDYLETYIIPTFGYRKKYKLSSDYSYFWLIRKILRSGLSLEVKWMYKGTFMFVPEKTIRIMYEFIQAFRVDRRQEARNRLLCKYPVLNELGYPMLTNFSDPDFELTEDIVDMWRLTEDHCHQYNDLVDNDDDCELLTDAVSCPLFQKKYVNSVNK